MSMHAKFEEIDLEELETVVGGASQVVSRDFGLGWSGFYHDYRVVSDPLPAGISRAQANDILQAFNAPTAAALSGAGNDPHATHGLVVDPLTEKVPVGLVTLEHGDGIAVNTTTAAHPFIGTITRELQENPNGTFSIVTTGTGHGTNPYLDGVGIGTNFLVSGAQHLGNVLGGPGIFQRLDDVAQQHAQQQFGLGVGNDAHAGYNLLSNGTELGQRVVFDYVDQKLNAGEDVNILPGMVIDAHGQTPQSDFSSLPFGSTPSPADPHFDAPTASPGYDPFQTFAPTSTAPGDFSFSNAPVIDTSNSVVTTQSIDHGPSAPDVVGVTPQVDTTPAGNDASLGASGGGTGYAGDFGGGGGGDSSFA